MKTRETARRVAALAVTGLASSMALGGAAQAAPLGHEHYEFVETGTSDECGVLVDYEWTGSGNTFVREVNGSDGQAYLGHDNYSFRTVITNTETGAWMVVRGKSLFAEIAGTHIEGNVWEFTQHEAGQPFVIEDSTGTVLARSRGLVTYRLLFRHPRRRPARRRSARRRGHRRPRSATGHLRRQPVRLRRRTPRLRPGTEPRIYVVRRL